MGSKMRSGGWLGGLVFLGGIALATATPAVAQSGGAAMVSLVLQDFSDCQNGNVSDGKEELARGRALIVRNSDGTTSVKVGMTLVANTTYHFFLKCVRQIGDITTNDEGVGEAIFSFPTNLTGNVFAFDVYPEGAPAGNKLQSVQVRIQ